MATSFGLEEFRIVLLCSLWYAISSTNSVIGKKILTDFPFPVTVAMVQVFSTALYLSLTFDFWYVPPKKPLPKSSLLKLILPLSFGKAFAAITAHVSIWKVSVSYSHTVKATMPVFTVILLRVIFGEMQSGAVYCSLIPIVGGVMVATATELSFNMVGLLSALLATFTFAVQSIFTKKALRDLQLNHLHLLLLITDIASIMLLIAWALYDLRRIIPELESGKVDILWLLVMLTINGFLNFAQNVVAFTVLSLVTPLSYAVASTTKRIFVITVSIMFLRNPISLYNGVGMLAAIFGVFLYNKAKYDANRRKHEITTHTEHASHSNNVTNNQ